MLLFVAESIECASDECALKVKRDEARNLGQKFLENPGHSFVIGSASSFCMATNGPHIVWFQPRASGWNRPHLPADEPDNADEDSDLL